MDDVSCPGCRMPISARAVAVGECPCCGHSFREPPTAVIPPLVADTKPVIPPAPPPKKRRVWPLAVAATTGVLVLGGVGVFALLPPAVPVASEQAREPNPPPVLPSPTTTKPAPAPPNARESLPPPRVAEPDPPPEPVKPVPMPKPEPPKLEPVKVITIDPAAGDRKLDAPDGTAELLPLDGDTRLTLTGRVKVLRVGSVNGHTLLDTTGLVADEVVFTDDLNGSPTITVKAGVRVRVEKVVEGAVNLTADASGGEIVFAEKGEVRGGAVLTLTAKRVDAQALLGGGSKLGVTLTSGGSLRTRLMDEGATIEYRAASGNTDKLTIETGDLRGGAKVMSAK